MGSGIAQVVLRNAEGLFESGSETFLVGLVRVKISTGTREWDEIARHLGRGDLQLVEGIGYLQDKNMGEAVFLPNKSVSSDAVEMDTCPPSWISSVE